MAKNKKTSQHQKQAAKERNNKQARDYEIGLINFLKRLDLYQHLSLLPKEVMGYVIAVRISSIRMVPTGDIRLNSTDTQTLKEYLETIVSKECLITYTNGATFTYKEFVTYLLTLTLSIKSYLQKNTDKKVEEAFKEMEQFVNENCQLVTSEMQFNINLLAGWISHPFRGYITFSSLDIHPTDGGVSATDSWCSRAIYQYKCTDPSKQKVSIDGKKREVVEMAYASLKGELVWCTVPPSLLKKAGDTPIRVFIQKHAINRITERLDVILNDAQFSVVAQSIVELKTVRQIGPDRFLLPTYFNGCKLGYMVGNYVDDILVVTTFLFITQEGTPEGLLLDKLTGFKKLDKSYLCIDKLSTFIKSDIASNPELVKLLQEANLGHLVDLHKEIGYICKEQSENLNDPSFILEYIQRKREEQQLSQTEMQEQEGSSYVATLI